MNGVIAAVATPIGADGRLHVGTFERLIDMLIESGVDGVCLGGATSEYPSVGVDEDPVLVPEEERRFRVIARSLALGGRRRAGCPDSRAIVTPLQWP